MSKYEVRAWEVTEQNINTLHHISGLDARMFTKNPGWVMVEDWTERPRFLLLPNRIFYNLYPDVELTVLKTDETSQ